MRAWMFVTLITSGVCLAQTPPGLRLDEAIVLGKRYSRPLQIAGAKAEGAVARSGEAHTALLPSLRVTGAYQRVSPGNFTLGITIPGFGTFGPPVVENNYQMRVAVSQPLFTGFRLSNNARAAELAAQAGALDRAMAESDVVLNVTTAYWTLYQTLETRKVVAENVARLESYLADTERLVHSGVATRNDQLRVEVQLAQARGQHIDAENDVRLAAMNLNILIGEPLAADIVPASTPDDSTDAPAHSPPGLDSLAAAALAARKDIAASSSMAQAAAASVSAAQGGWWPQIDLNAGYNYNRPNQRYQPVTDRFREGWDIGVQLQMDLWNWGRTARQTEQAEATLRQSREQLALLRDNVALEVNRAALTMMRAKEKIAVMRLGVTQAEESSRMTLDRYHNGLANSTELLDASVALLQARTNLTGAKVEYAIAAARLTRAMGTP